MANELDIENYHGKDRIREKETSILEKWKKLLALLAKHKQHLQLSSQLMALSREADTIMHSIKELSVSICIWSLGVLIFRDMNEIFHFKIFQHFQMKGFIKKIYSL